MRHFIFIPTVCVFAVLIIFSVGKTSINNSSEFTPVIEDNTNSDTSPEEVTEIMTPICKIFFDAHPSFKDRSGAFSPDGRYFAVSNATSSFMSRTCLFDFKTGKILKRFSGNHSQDNSSPVAFSQDSRRLAFLCENSVIVWDIPEDKEICHIPIKKHMADQSVNSVVNSLRFTEDPLKLCGVLGNSGKIWLAAESGETLRTFDTLKEGAFFCYPDLSHALVWDKKTGKHFLQNLSNNVNMERTTNFCLLEGYWGADARENLSKMVFSDDGKLFALENQNQDYHGNSLFVWDAATGSDVCTVPLDYKLTAYTFLPGTHTLVTACDPEIEHVVSPLQHIPLTTPMRKPVAKAKTKAIIEFWDIDHLVWYNEKVNLFPRKTKSCYIEDGNDIHHMVPSPDGKLLYMRSGKKIVEYGSVLSIANGYIFSLTPNETPEIPVELQLDDDVIIEMSPGPVRNILP